MSTISAVLSLLVGRLHHVNLSAKHLKQLATLFQAFKIIVYQFTGSLALNNFTVFLDFKGQGKILAKVFSTDSCLSNSMHDLNVAIILILKK